MIVNFFLDNRIGGPHNYSTELQKLSKGQFLNVTSGKSKFCKTYITNLRNFWKYFFIIEILINIFEILFMFKKDRYKYFYVFSIFNFAPIISGILLRKKIKWFIVEEPKFFTKFIFKILNLLGNFETVVISKFIANILKIKKYKIVYPFIDTKFWKNIPSLNYKKKYLKLLCVGNLNKTKNHLNLLKYLQNINISYEISIIGEILKTQKNYIKEIQEIKKNINKNTSNKVIILGRLNKHKIKNLLKKTDLYILPSLTEGLPLSLMEAMSMNSLCLISSNSNKSKLVKNNKNGFIFQLSKNSFKQSIIKIINLNKSKKINIKNEARKTIINVNLKNKIND